MIRFPNALRDWHSDTFRNSLKSEIENLRAGSLPLLYGVSHGGVPDESDISATVLRVTDDGRVIQTHVGIFFTEILAGCSCGDEPMSMQGYCEMQISIDKATAEAEINLIPG